MARPTDPLPAPPCLSSFTFPSSCSILYAGSILVMAWKALFPNYMVTMVLANVFSSGEKNTSEVSVLKGSELPCFRRQGLSLFSSRTHLFC